MKVNLIAKGTLKKYFGAEKISIELPEKAKVSDLLIQIDQTMGDHIPDFLWNKAESRFRGPVVITLNKKVVTDLSINIFDGQEIKIYKPLVGG